MIQDGSVECLAHDAHSGEAHPRQRHRAGEPQRQLRAVPRAIPEVQARRPAGTGGIDEERSGGGRRGFLRACAATRIEARRT